jgi:hypothetical protein
LQLHVSSSFPPCIRPSRTSKIVKASSKYYTMVSTVNTSTPQYPTTLPGVGAYQLSTPQYLNTRYYSHIYDPKGTEVGVAREISRTIYIYSHEFRHYHKHGLSPTPTGCHPRYFEPSLPSNTKSVGVPMFSGLRATPLACSLSYHLDQNVMLTVKPP